MIIHSLNMGCIYFDSPLVLAICLNIYIDEKICQYSSLYFLPTITFTRLFYFYFVFSRRTLHALACFAKEMRVIGTTLCQHVIWPQD